MREEFKQCTVITVAHRLDTILDSDFILVMNNGSVAEFAPPKELLSDESSCFSKLLNGLEVVCEASRYHLICYALNYVSRICARAIAFLTFKGDIYAE